MHSSTMSIACPPIDCVFSGRGLNPYGTCPPLDTSPYEHNDRHSWKHHLPVTSFADSNQLTHYKTTHHCVCPESRHTNGVVSEVHYFKKIHCLKCNIPASLTSAWQNSLHFIPVTNVYGFILDILKSLESKCSLFSSMSVKYFSYIWVSIVKK